MFDIENSMPKATEKLFKVISQMEEIKDFTLVGGTALAIHIKHRTSEDLDFFINKNKINTALQHKIDDMHSKLVQLGYLVSEVGENDEFQQDYNISGVKITYHVTSVTDLMQDIVKYGHINIAGKNAIAAMKMYTILKHRIKSRDFYDVKYFMEQEGCTLNDLIEKLQLHFPKYCVSQKKIEKRFLETKLNSDDEGFESLAIKNNETFEDLRAYFKKAIFEMYNNEVDFISSLKNRPELLECKLHKKFGLTNKTLAIKLFEYHDYDNLEKVRKNPNFNPLERDTEGKNIYNHFAEAGEIKLFDDFLMIIENIPDMLKEQVGVLNRGEDFLEIIEKHRVVNRCLGKSKEIVDSILNEKNIDRDLFDKLLTEKASLLKSISETQHNFNETTIEESVANFANEDSLKKAGPKVG